MSGDKVLLLGGTGAMGVYLVPALLNAGFLVQVTSRSQRNSSHPHLHYLQGNALDSGYLRDVLAETHPDAIVDFMSYSTPEFQNRRDMLLNGTGHYLFLSSYRIFADSHPDPLTERSPRLLDICKDQAYLATDEYALAKARQEDLLRTSGRTNWTILRPGITYSINRFQFGTLEANTLCYRARQGLPVIMAREILEKHTTMTWAGDVAKLVSRLILNPGALSEDYNVVSAEHHLWSEIAGYYREFLNLRIIETDLATYERVVGRPAQIRYDRLFNRILDNTKVLAAARIAQLDFMPLHKGLNQELSEFLKRPFIQYPNLALNARMDKATGTRISLAGLSLKRRIRYFLDRLR